VSLIPKGAMRALMHAIAGETDRQPLVGAAGRELFDYVSNKSGKFAMGPEFRMADFDTPDPYRHKMAQSVTADSFGDITDWISRYTRDRNTSGELYRTPGGAHFFETGFSRNPEPSVWFKELDGGGIGEKIDPIYRKLVERSGEYSTRLSPKTDALDDYIAEPVLSFAGPRAQVDPVDVERVALHHALIKGERAPGGEAMQAERIRNQIAGDLPSVDPRTAALLRARFKLGIGGAAALGGYGALDES
jgi:hypothetical protein